MSAPAAPSPPRSLLPQEHGAWGQLAMPLLTALLLSDGPRPAALLLAGATVAGFLAHEPWLVLLGHRGVRAKAEAGPRARRLMWGWLAAAAAAGLGGLWLAPSPARLALLLPAAFGAATVAFVLARRERTIPGELTVVSALASSGLAVALAGGASMAVAGLATGTWLTAFAASVFAVQVVLARTQRKGARDLGHRHALIVAALLALAGGAAVALVPGQGWVVAAAAAPTALLSVAVCLGPFGARQLRQLGWSLVVATSATLAVLVAGLRWWTP